MPTITLVTPSFNQARYIERTMRSVVSQRYPKLEYIIMDGGSTDGSVDIIRRYADRLHYWQSALDGGQGAAIIEGWRRGTGQLLGWINSDDILLDGSLEAIGSAFNPHHQIYYGDDLSIDSSDRVTRYRVNARAPRWAFRHGLLFTGQPGTFFARSCVEQVGFFDASLVCAMEYDLMLRMFAAGARARLVPRPLAALRHYADTKTSRLAQLTEDEQRRIFRDRIPGFFGDPHWGSIARKVFRAACLIRYTNPRNWSRTVEKVRVAGWRTPVSRYLTDSARMT